jgi:hypothetical protein
MIVRRIPRWALVVSVTACGGASSNDGGSSETGTGSTSGTASADSSTGTPATTGTATTGTPTTGTPTTTEGSSSGGGSSTTEAVDTSTGGTSGTTTTGSGTESSTGEVLDYDCDALVQPFVSELELDAPRGYHDLAFDEAGHILGYDGGNAIVQVTYDDDLSVFLPGVGSAVQGMEMLAGDLLFVNDSGELRRATPRAQVSTVAPGFFGAYGLTFGPDGQAYVSANDTVFRVDPESGDFEELVTLTNGVSARAVVFGLDSTTLYIASLGGGDVFSVPLDAALDPTDEPSVFASGVGDFWHDGIGMDACGNLYVPEYFSSGLYRIDPAGVVTTLYDSNSASSQHYGHGLEWGSGVDGWNDHALYLPQPYDDLTVNEVVIGVPSAATVRTWEP